VCVCTENTITTSLWKKGMLDREAGCGTLCGGTRGSLQELKWNETQRQRNAKCEREREGVAEVKEKKRQIQKQMKISK